MLMEEGRKTFQDTFRLFACLLVSDSGMYIILAASVSDLQEVPDTYAYTHKIKVNNFHIIINICKVSQHPHSRFSLKV